MKNVSPSQAAVSPSCPEAARPKWAILAVWIVIFMAMGPLAGKFEDAQENDPADYLPAKAESVKAIEELEEFPSGDIADAITVFNRDGGLEPQDEAAIEEIRTGDQLERASRGWATPRRRSSPRTAARRS